MSSEQGSICSSSSLQLEVDSAGAQISDSENAATASCDVTPAAKTQPTGDSAKEVSVTDGAGKREARSHSGSGNLSIVSEDSGLKYFSQGSFLSALYSRFAI